MWYLIQKLSKQSLTVYNGKWLINKFFDQHNSYALVQTKTDQQKVDLLFAELPSNLADRYFIAKHETASANLAEAKALWKDCYG